MRWLCDEMLARLARLLRAAGHDTVLAEPQTADATLAARAEAEGRILLTRDRELAGRTRERGLLLRSGRAKDQAMEVAQRIATDWRTTRFTRCLMDNTPLRPATAEEIAAMPASSREGPGPFRACLRCGRAYWPGSHVKRLEALLDEIAAAGTGGAGPGSRSQEDHTMADDRQNPGPYSDPDKDAPKFKNRARGTREGDAEQDSVMPGREVGAGGGKVDGPAGAGGAETGARGGGRH